MAVPNTEMCISRHNQRNDGFDVEVAVFSYLPGVLRPDVAQPLCHCRMLLKFGWSQEHGAHGKRKQ